VRQGPAPRVLGDQRLTSSQAPGGAVLTLARKGVRLEPTLALPAALPLGRLLTGKSATEAALLLPRLFSLCRMAQETAACLALGLPVPDPATLAAEVLRDHLVLLCATLPRAAGLQAQTLPSDPALFLCGPARRLPRTLAGLKALCAQHPVLATLLQLAPGEACSPALPAPSADTAFTGAALENSPAGRQSQLPLLREIEARFGRGPLWRYAGVLADAMAALHGRLPAARLVERTALVPAARGTYALRLALLDGRVTALSRATPTDHLLAPGGALLAAMASLPAAKSSLAPLVLALHDPCIPVTLQEVDHA
jgi:hypothetical protein